MGFLCSFILGSRLFLNFLCEDSVVGYFYPQFQMLIGLLLFQERFGVFLVSCNANVLFKVNGCFIFFYPNLRSEIMVWLPGQSLELD